MSKLNLPSIEPLFTRDTFIRSAWSTVPEPVLPGGTLKKRKEPSVLNARTLIESVLAGLLNTERNTVTSFSL